MANFTREDWPKGVVHKKKKTIRFVWQGRIVDLRKASPALLELAAKADDCSVLVWNPKGDAPESSQKTEEQPPAGDKPGKKGGKQP